MASSLKVVIESEDDMTETLNYFLDGRINKAEIISGSFLHGEDEIFISTNNLRINLWSLQSSNRSLNIIDVKPTNMEELTEGITSAEFHPTHCNKLAYGRSKGSIRLIDLRQSALCDTHSQLLESTLNYGLERVWPIGYMKGSRRLKSTLNYGLERVWSVGYMKGPKRLRATYVKKAGEFP